MKLYRHVKSGRVYAVLQSVASLEADESGVVVYQGVDEDRVWVRPAAEFHDGRFVKLRPSDLEPRADLFAPTDDQVEWAMPIRFSPMTTRFRSAR